MKHLLAIAVVLLASEVHALNWQDSPSVHQLFSEAGITGTFVLYDVTADRYIGHDRTRAKTRFVPASTFKIPNTLIGLSVGVVQSVDEVLPYGGRPQPFKAWEKDMPLRAAIAQSNAAIYQELARKIGLERMRNNVSRIHFGNEEIGDTVDNFWLVGPLKISAIEQTQFLARLAQGRLPYPQAIQKNVRDIVRLEHGKNWALYGKSGWENAPGQGVGWWVGWVQKRDRIYAYALNMDIKRASDASKREQLGKASLKTLGVL